MMLSPRAVCLLLALTCSAPALALEPNEILVIANVDYPASTRLGRYYCQQRGIPGGHVVPVSLGPALRDTISRADYEKRLARPIRRIFATRPDLENIKCLVTTYGVPFRVGRRRPLPQSEGRLKELKALLGREQDALKEEEAREQPNAIELQRRKHRISELELDIDRITGKETEASVDSELSLVLWRAYELHRWRPNALRSGAVQPFKTLMVCRLDGPDYGVARGLVDKALAAEEKGLTGTACVDSRGLYHKKDMYAYYDQSMRDLALLTQLRTSLPVREEKTDALFAPGSCPGTALYCGWYSLRKYVDAFDFVEGAVGYHIASLEAVDLRNPKSRQWCPALLMDGITATLGAVGEPYLRAFPQPKAFFLELFNGRCLVEAFYRTKAFNSWQMVLIGDPLYRPFRPKSPNGP